MDKCTYQIWEEIPKNSYSSHISLIIFNGDNLVENLCNKKTERIN